jgi:hypothetical protein
MGDFLLCSKEKSDQDYFVGDWLQNQRNKNCDSNGVNIS